MALCQTGQGRETERKHEIIRCFEITLYQTRENIRPYLLPDSGARGVVVIAVGNEHGDTSSNPGRY